MQSLHHFDWSVRDMRFLLWQQFRVQDTLLTLPGMQASDLDQSLLDTLLEQAQRFASRELDPVNIESDQQGCSLNSDGSVQLPERYAAIWQKLVQAGWTQLAKPLAGKIALPMVARQAYLELFFGACPAFMMYGGFGAPIADLIRRDGNAHLQRIFSDKLLSLDWGACFCMTEPQAGSDVGAITTRALPQADGSYRLEGEKIFITAGMHDLVENLVYLVVARLPDAPAGTLGLSCFLVPRFKLNAEGATTPEANGVQVTRIEKKMGLAGCATTALTFGLDAPCTGYMLGTANTALRQLGTLMAQARMSTGLIALGIASKAYQNAAHYAQQRQQGAAIRQALNPKAPRVAIAQHADVQRMLLEMKAKVEGCRALLTKLSLHYSFLNLEELANTGMDPDTREMHERWVVLLTPLVKAYHSDQAWRISELAIQVYGGHGYIRDNPVEQAARDCKILSIWEGTNFMQSAELIREKCAMGRPSVILEQALHAIGELLENPSCRAHFPDETTQLAQALSTLRATHNAMGAFTKARHIDHVFFNSTRYLKLMAETLITWLLLDGALLAKEQLAQAETSEDERRFLTGRITSMKYFVHYLLPLSMAEASIIQHAPQLDFDTTHELIA